jgi:VCBS repeat protein/ASPM-SPD-2-Hydin domain-containing protein/centrosomal CEP192-like protein
MRSSEMRTNSRVALGVGLALFGLISVCSPSASAQRYMFGRADFPAGGAPQSVVTADFNGDGVTDLAVANQNDNTVSILLGKPDGTFAAKADYAVGVSPRMVIVGDFNRDGKLDLAVVNNGSNSVSVLLGSGDGTFQAHMEYAAGSGPVSAVAADLNGDGKLDLAVANAGANTVSVLLGNGDGTFKTHVDDATGPQPSSVTAADFNGDGKLDLAVANSDCPSSPCGPGSVSVLLGSGDGTFQIHVDCAAGTGPSSVAAGDFSGDGKTDLAVANSSDNTVSILLGNGDGTFQAHQDTPVGAGPDGLTVSDLNRDGRLDLAVSNQTAGTVSILLGNGDGTFQAHADYYAGSGPRGIAVADFNGDGPFDLAVANSDSNTVSVLLGRGDGTLENVIQYLLGDGASISIAAGSFNGDSKTDLVVANQDCNPTCQPGPVSVLLGNGDGTFAPHVDYPTGNGPTSVVTGDFNRDGILDLALADYSSNAVSVLLGNGDGTFRPHVDDATGTGPLAVTVGDFNGDGKLDLAVAVDSMFAYAAVMLGNGDGTFQAATTYSVGNLPRAIAAGDFNNDGKLDLVIANKNDNTVSVLLGVGNGTFQPQVTYPTGNGPFSIATADFNGDGKLDLAVANQFDGSVSILLGNGDGTFKAPVNYPASMISLGVTTGDFNGDGKLDLAVANGRSASVSVLLGNGDGTFQPHTDYATGWNTYPSSLVGGDFTGVGGSDVAVATEVGVSVLLNSPVISMFASRLVFATQAVGTTSASQTITLANPSSEPLRIAAIVASGDFAESNNCGASLAIGATCTVTVTFTPTASGARNGSITFTDGAASSPQTLSLAGTGLFTGPGASFSPSSLSFAAQPVGITSAAQTVTLSNPGTASLSITSISASGDFAQTNNCGSSVAAGASCSLSVTFTPTASGTRTGTLAVTDNAPTSPQSVSLSGSGNVPVASVSPSSLTFSTQSVGTTSAAQTVTLTNTGGAPLNLTSLAASGDFAQTNNCGSSVAAGASCTINVTFTPTTSGTRTGTLTIADNASGSPQTVSLTGTGGSTAPALTLSPSSLTFGNQSVGTTSAPQAVTLSNTGNGGLSLTSIAASGDFAQTNNCGASVAAGSHCTISVTFTPTASGTRTGTLAITDNATGSPHTASLTGSGTLAAPVASVSPVSLSFGSQVVGTASAPQLVTLSNTGNAPLLVSGVAASGDFGQTNNCGVSVAAGAHCTINVTFTPTASGAQSGTLVITDNAAGSPRILSLIGSGSTSPAPVASLSPLGLSFANRLVGTTSAAQLVMLTNTGNASLSIASIAALPGSFAQSNNCGSLLAAAASCTINVTFTPTIPEIVGGMLVIRDNAASGLQLVTLTGAGSAPMASVSPTSLDFPYQMPGVASAPQAVTLANIGGLPLAISSIKTSASNFAPSSNCGSSLAAAAKCTISVVFTGTINGATAATLSIIDNAAGSPHVVSLGVTAKTPQVSLSPSTLSFSSQALGVTSPAETVTLANVGGASLSISSISTGPGGFAQTNNCPASLMPAASCSIRVTFTPAAFGVVRGTLSLADSAGGSPQNVSLIGNGAGPAVLLSASSLIFGSQLVGTTSAAQILALVNVGNATLNITSIAASGDFAQSNNCGASVAAGASCSLSVAFTPTATGSRAGTLTIADNAGNAQSVTLTGTGSNSAATAAVSLSPSSLNFGAVVVGTKSAPQVVTLTNGGATTLAISSLSTTSVNFAQTNNCGSSVAAGAHCTISVTFFPSAAGSVSGSLVVSDGASGSPQTASLTGAGGLPIASLSVSSLSFGYQRVGTTSTPRSVTLTNKGNAPLSISGITTSGDFGQTNNCGQSLSAGSSCTINVTFTPTAFFTRTGTLTVADNSGSSPQTVSLTGTGSF